MVLSGLGHQPWSELDPARHAFDAAAAAMLVDDVFARTKANAGSKPPPYLRAVQRAFFAELGPWTADWLWSHANGGPVATALDRYGEDEGVTRDQVVAALTSWRRFLEELAVIFESLPTPASADLLASADIERACAAILSVVAARTAFEDAWYGTFTEVVCWYLESKGFEADDVVPIVTPIVEGNFSSWIEPAPDVGANVFREIGTRLAAQAAGAARPPLDATSSWSAIRAQAFRFYEARGPHEPIRRDGHRHFLQHDRSRDPDRADRMDVALDACRVWAASGEPLTFGHVAGWQAIVLGAPQEFRRADAFAKQGRERYPVLGARAAFETYLEDALDGATPLAVRAARVYLDVCFVHPFVDGNGRAARLLLDAVLSRAGFGLHAADPIFRIARTPSADGAAAMVATVDLLIGPNAVRG